MKRSPHPRNDSGLATVEFAIVGSLLLMLVFAILTFGNILAKKSAITSAVQDAARAASLPQGCSGAPCTLSQMKTIFTNHTGITTGVIFDDVASKPCTFTNGVAPAGTNAVMKVTYPMPVRVIGISTSTINVTATGMMPCGS
jgi:Flp pilus assembly protein TadG